MTFIEAERRENERYALKQAFFEDVKLDRLAQICRDLIKLSDMKIKLLEVYDIEKQPFMDALEQNIERLKRNK
jgi:hypothetical protein